MALVERTVVTKVEVVSEYKHIQIQTDNQIIDDETGEIKAKDIYIFMSSDSLLEKVKQLREITGVGFKDCKHAIDENLSLIHI